MESIKENSNENTNRPLISSFCPAVVRLIQCKYPSLTENIVKRKAPHDLAAHFAIEKLVKAGAKKEEIGSFLCIALFGKNGGSKPTGSRERIDCYRHHQYERFV